MKRYDRNYIPFQNLRIFILYVYSIDTDMDKYFTKKGDEILHFDIEFLEEKVLICMP